MTDKTLTHLPDYNSLPRLKANKALNDFWIFFTEQLLMIRAALPFYFFLQTLLPLAFVFAMGHYAGEQPSADRLLRIISGTITFNLAYLGLGSLASKLSQMRQEGTLHYYSALPINRLSFVAGILAARLVLLAPSIIIPIIGGKLLYSLPLHLDLWLLPVLGLGILCLSLAGITVGVVVKNHEVAQVLVNALVFVIALASPTFMGSSMLPLPLQWLGWLLPTTYLSDAFVYLLGGQYTDGLYFDIALLVVMSGLGLLLVARFLPWQED